MPGVHDDGVLIVIDIRRVLKAPRLTVQSHRHHAQVLPCRVRDAARVAHVLHAQQAFRVSGCFFHLRCGNVARVFLGL